MIFTLSIARLVPLLFGLSAALVAGRFLFDRISRRSHRLGQWAFAGVMALGIALLAPFASRAVLLAMAELSFDAGKWAQANGRFVSYRRLGGRLSEPLSLDWASALMNLHRWREAETVLISGVRRTPRGLDAYPQTILLIGICRYYEGRFEAADKTLQAVRAGPQGFLADYFLGRMADRRGDAQEAIRAYLSCLGRSSQFYPAVYHAIRLLVARGDRVVAREVLVRFLGERPPDPPTVALTQSIEGSIPPLPEREFFLVQK